MKVPGLALIALLLAHPAPAAAPPDLEASQNAYVAFLKKHDALIESWMKEGQKMTSLEPAIKALMQACGHNSGPFAQLMARMDPCGAQQGGFDDPAKKKEMQDKMGQFLAGLSVVADKLEVPTDIVNSCDGGFAAGEQAWKKKAQDLVAARKQLQASGFVQLIDKGRSQLQCRLNTYERTGPFLASFACQGKDPGPLMKSSYAKIDSFAKKTHALFDDVGALEDRAYAVSKAYSAKRAACGAVPPPSAVPAAREAASTITDAKDK